jgi:hypothetical protein
MDIVEEFHACDWCGSSVKNIGPCVTGFMSHKYDVYLCVKPGCGHEMELMPMKYDPSHYVELKYPL